MTISTTVQNPLCLFVGGEWLKPESDATIDVHESHTGQLHTTVAEASAKDVNNAVAAARRAFDEGPWPRLSAAERASYLNKLADALESRTEQIARQTTLQNGGLLAMTQGVNTPRSTSCRLALSPPLFPGTSRSSRPCRRLRRLWLRVAP